MLMTDMSEERQLNNFTRVMMSSIHVEVLEIQAACRDSEELEGRLLGWYGLDYSLWLLMKELMEWAELPGKGSNTSVLLQKFKKKFIVLSALDRTVLNTSKVLLFIKSVDSCDCEKC